MQCSVVKSTLMAFLLLWGCCALAAEPDPRLQKMERGETVVSVSKTKKGHQKFKMMAILNSAPEAVWSIIRDCNKYKTTMTQLKSARLVRKEGRYFICETVVDTPFPLKDLRALTRSTHSVQPGKRWERKWKLIEGDYKVNQGSWTLKPYGSSKTLVIYKNIAEPTIDVPQAIQDMARRKTLPGLMAHLREQVEK
jgi:ribosome-associated toxin RatA of RatAB toxin-antitoxin module